MVLDKQLGIHPLGELILPHQSLVASKKHNLVLELINSKQTVLLKKFLGAVVVHIFNPSIGRWRKGLLDGHSSLPGELQANRDLASKVDNKLNMMAHDFNPRAGKSLCLS